MKLRRLPREAPSAERAGYGHMLLRHSAIYVSSNLITGLFGLATAIVLTRVLTPADYGVYGLGIAIALFTSSVVFDWHGISYLRFIKSDREREERLPTFLALSFQGTAQALDGLLWRPRARL